jgi:hypothetical protein
MYLACAALFLVGMSAQASFIIDHFEAPPVGGQFVCDPATPGECTGSPTDTWTTTTDDYSQDLVLGGERFIQVQSGTGQLVVTGTAGGGDTYFAFSSSTNAQGWGYVLWDGAAYSDPTYNLPKDFTEGGANNRIEVTAGGDLGGGYLSVRLTDGIGGAAEVSRLINSVTDLTYTLNFSEFAGVDFTNIASVEMGINGVGGLFNDAPANYDGAVHVLEVTGDQVIPEPATLTLIGAGLLALGFFRKRLA